MAEKEALVDKIKQICKSSENTNQIQNLLVEVENSDQLDVKDSIDILYGVFCYHLKVGTWLKSDEYCEESKDNEKSIAKDIVSNWMLSSFSAFLTLLIQKICHGLPHLQCKSAEIFLQIISAEHETGRSEVKIQNRFVSLLKDLLQSNFSDEFLNLLTEYMKYLDVQCYFLSTLPVIFEMEDFETNERVAENTFKFLNIFTTNMLDLQDIEKSYYFKHSSDTDFQKDYKNEFSSAWLAFLRLNLSSVLRKKVLVDLDSQVIPHLENPKVLIDFLADCYNGGGVTSLLALNSLFILMNDHNLDYPDFYTNLYKIIDPSIFQMKYKSRFFHSIDLFLTSTYLPAYVIAGFVKKFSRMLLFTPAPDVMMVLVFLKNMLIRHPSSRVLIHKKQGIKSDQTIGGDPYNYDELNLSQCGALDSSLWEIETLSSHYSSDVKKYVASFKKDFPAQEADIAVYFDKTYEEIFHLKIEKGVDSDKDIPVNFVKSDIFEQTDTDMWVF